MSKHSIHTIMMGSKGTLHCDMIKSLFANRCMATENLDWSYTIHYGDADVWCGRSVTLTQYAFEEITDAPVVVSIDHDTEFCPDTIQYLANYARNIDGLVGTIIAKKRRGAGVNVKCTRDVQIEAKGSFELRPPYDFVGGGMYAITRNALTQIRARCELPEVTFGSLPKSNFVNCDGLPQTDNVGVPFCMPWVDHCEGKWRVIREDVALCYRAHIAGVPVHATAWPQTRHHGDYGYTLKDASDGAAAPAHPV